MDEAVSQIVGRPLKMPVALRPFVGGFGQHFVDGLGHGSQGEVDRRESAQQVPKGNQRRYEGQRPKASAMGP